MDDEMTRFQADLLKSIEQAKQGKLRPSPRRKKTPVTSAIDSKGELRPQSPPLRGAQANKPVAETAN